MFPQMLVSGIIKLNAILWKIPGSAVVLNLSLLGHTWDIRFPFSLHRIRIIATNSNRYYHFY
jgi:hypothetical protein